MSYKYLYEKLEQTKGGATISNLVFIASEALRQKKSEAFSDFMDLDDEEICDVLDWKKEQFVFDKIRDKDESFAYLIFENKQTGFLAEYQSLQYLTTFAGYQKKQGNYYGNISTRIENRKSN